MTHGFASAQTLLRVFVQDSLSGRALPRASVEVDIQTEAQPFRPSPFDCRAMGNGWFVIGASFRSLSSRVKTGVDTRFRIAVSHPGHTASQTELPVTAADFTPASEQISLGDATLIRSRLAGAPFETIMSLSPLPIRLTGQLVRDNVLTDPIAGARVTVNDDIGTAQTTDSDGRFVFATLPLAQTVTVKAAKDTETTSETITLNYAKPTTSLALSFLNDAAD